MPLLTVVLGFDLKAATGLSHTIVGKPAASAAGTVGGRVKLLQRNSVSAQIAARLSLTGKWPGCMHLRVCARLPHYHHAHTPVEGNCRVLQLRQQWRALYTA